MEAKGEGHAVSKEWDLVADTIGLDINNRKLEQTLAWGDSIRPYANSPAYAMRADSLALDTPGQQLKEVRGFGNAWLGGTIDSVSKQRDWMRGDTVVAQFVQRDSAGTTRQPSTASLPGRPPNRITWTPTASIPIGRRSTTLVVT